MTAIPAGPIRFTQTITYALAGAVFIFDAGTIAMWDGRGRVSVRLDAGKYLTFPLTFPQRTRSIEAASMTVANP